ncbi:type II toxin-antitoxin system VapC family toxin [Sandaracinobacteroides saxicola]|uniref:Type II toxin-antitoxin system VapC family toxin n=1 Tax=Sandaracinobacteroides saxicola TaxID=2759707 RepID=A0A7G5IKB6_9SPHN|nr:type II toxin-antitoxin system VapC family toxin [Sandaracinobacteroides saxicola]QMW23808.1 type II toxin-antitoxin system VapC family toxin [Sandaracinobacteroides saxicola]
MRLLFDTHLLLWFTAGDARFTAQAREMLGDVRNEPLFSSISIWEIGIKQAAGRPDFRWDAKEVETTLRRAGWGELPFNALHAQHAAALPLYHRDPFDRALIGQAISETVTLLTVDTTLTRYPGPILLVYP